VVECVCVCVYLRAFVILIMANKARRPKVGVPMAINCQFSIMPMTCESHLRGSNPLFAFLTGSLIWPTLWPTHTHRYTHTMGHKYAHTEWDKPDILGICICYTRSH